MNQSSKIILIVLTLMYLAPAQATFYIDSGSSQCRVFAEDEADEGKKKNGKKEGEEQEEEEPDCED